MFPALDHHDHPEYGDPNLFTASIGAPAECWLVWFMFIYGLVLVMDWFLLVVVVGIAISSLCRLV